MLIKEADFGTPKSLSEKMVTLEIDGQAVTVPEGTSIMRAAMELGTKIPKLCATDSVKSFGSCRLCLVEPGIFGMHFEARGHRRGARGRSALPAFNFNKA